MAPNKANSPWWDAGYNARIQIKVSADGHERIDKPCEIELNFTQLLSDAGSRAAFDARSIRVVEVDENGQVLNNNITWQFDPASDYDPRQNARGTLVWLMNGITPADATRFFDVYMDGKNLALAASRPLVSVQDDVADEEQLCFKVETQNAVYFYQKPAAGFSSMHDTDGNDWIGYHPGGGSAGEYRGIPNVAPIGFHPGYDKSESRLISQGPLKATVYSETKDRLSACTWEFFPTYATFTLLKKGVDTYWLLYEGTPGGSFDPENDYIVHSNGLRRSATAVWDEVLPDPEWLYFGSGKTARVLYMVHHETDDKIDSYWPMQGNMTVFGFGRTSLGGTTLAYHMDAVPNRFTVGFAEDGAFPAAARIIDSAYRPISVTAGDVELRAEQ